jgi:DNA-binding transcriptional ArsR family regulator
MPNLSIIPARAVGDPALDASHVRVLCAVGLHTDASGGNVWTSIATLARESGVSESTVHRAINTLEEHGYLRVIPRTGRTNLYEVILQRPEGVSSVTPGGVTGDRGGVSWVTPKRPKRTPPKNDYTAQEAEVIDAVWRAYPKRPEPHPFLAARKAIVAVLREGASGTSVVRATQRYATHCALNKTEPQYVKSIPRFFADEFWKVYDVAMVHGRTREEWARSGQDVLEFDRLLEEQHA